MSKTVEGDRRTPTDSTASGSVPRVALVHHLTEPRGGVFQCLHIAEGLAAQGEPVHLFGLGDPQVRYFRPTNAPHTVLQAPARNGSHEQRFFEAVDSFALQLENHLPGRFDVVHVHDTLDAEAVRRIDSGLGEARVVRTVHHLEDVGTERLQECQLRAIVGPHLVITVSRFWQRELGRRYGINPVVVTNGIDHERVRCGTDVDAEVLRARTDAADRFLFLTVGGIAPRKGSQELMDALALLKARCDPSPLLVLIGGHSFNDYAEYRAQVLDRAARAGLLQGRDFVFAGTVSESQIGAWYRAADALVFPSLREGWGLVILEAMAAGVPVVASDIPVFREFMDDRDAVLVPPGDADALAAGMLRTIEDAQLRARLARRGPGIAAGYRWDDCVAHHRAIYRAAAREEIETQTGAPPGGRSLTR